jgi:hypothetical protein
MILRLSSSAQRGAILAVAGTVALFLIFVSVRGVWAVHSAAKGTEDGLERATRLEPDNPENWYELGRFWQYNLENSDNDKAIAAFRHAAAIDPYSADTYINLASAYESQDDIPDARENFLKAQKAYPLSAEISWRLGNFFLRQGDMDQAFREIRASVEADPSRGAEAFSRGLRVEPNINIVLDRALPALPSVYLDVIHDLSSEGRTTEGLIVWDRLRLLAHPQLSMRDVTPFVGALRGKGEFVEAASVWRQAVQMAGLGNLGDPPSSVLWDGGFESGFSNSGYSWIYVSNARGAQILRDVREKHSGNYSLRVTFDGTSDISFADVCHAVPVQPRALYQFSAWVRTRDLTSDQGVRFRIQSSVVGATPVLTPEMHGTTPWTNVEIPWTADAAAREAQVCIVRLASDQPDNRIRGTAWIDDVALVPRSSAATVTGSANR